MKTSISPHRKDGDDEFIEGWSADKQPSFPHLLLVLNELEGSPEDGVAEIGADYNDDEDDALSIVWANYPYFSKGDGSLRDMWGWVAVDLGAASYFGINLTGEEFRIPLCDPNSAKIAAAKLVEDDNA